MMLERSYFSLLLISSLLLIVVVLPLIRKDQAGSIPEQTAVRVLVGEAADQGMKGMVCVGEVLHLRGSIDGFDGYFSARANSEPKIIWKMAAKAWEISRYTHYTKGADHFYDIHLTQPPSWVNDGVFTYRYKDHLFYKIMK